MFNSIKRIFNLGWKSFVREKGIMVATVFVLFLVISLIGSLFLLRDMGEFLISSIQERIDISIYFKDAVSEDSILTIKKEIIEFPEIKKVVYVSQDKALNNFVDDHKDDFSLMGSIEELGVNPFLASLNVQAWKPSQYESVYAFLTTLETGEAINKIDYFQRESVIQKICSWSSTLSQAGLYVVTILFLIAIIVTLNTVRLSIYNSKKEIEIQKLVGASDWFIRGPFLIQGLLCGITASLISFLCLGLVCWFFSARIMSLFLDFNILDLFISRFWVLALIQFIVGVGLGVISSHIAVKRYLKV